MNGFMARKWEKVKMSTNVGGSREKWKKSGFRLPHTPSGEKGEGVRGEKFAEEKRMENSRNVVEQKGGTILSENERCDDPHR